MLGRGRIRIGGELVNFLSVVIVSGMYSDELMIQSDSIPKSLQFFFLFIITLAAHVLLVKSHSQTFTSLFKIATQVWGINAIFFLFLAIRLLLITTPQSVPITYVT